MIATPTTTSPSRAKLPNGLRWSDVWRDQHGNLIEGAREIPVDSDRRIAARLLLCLTTDCSVEKWAPFEYDPRGEVRPVDTTYCPKHGQPLVEVAADGSDLNPVASAKDRLTAKVRDALASRRQKAVDAAKAKAEALQVAATVAAKRTGRDMRGHVPSLVVTAAAMGGGIALAVAFSTVVTTAIGVALATAGAVAAYLMAYGLEWLQARRDGAELLGKAGRKARAKARRVAAAALTAGLWTAVAGVVGVDPATIGGQVMLLAAAVLAWAVNRTHWEELWETRRRLAELARRKAEDAARRAAEESVRLETEGPAPTAPVATEETPEVVGRRMADTWARIARSSTVPPGFLMSRTWIVAEETREVTVPIDGEVVRIGYEFAIESEPGVLVARLGSMQPPLVSAREWLAAMLGVQDSSTVSLVDRPEGRVNRGLLLLTDGAPLGGTVAWKGRAGVRTAPDGAVYVHVGRTMTGDDVEEAAYTPGQPFGGLVVGHTGGGKSAGTILTVLNDLAAGIFDTLYDPKQLVDYADLIGVIPIGVTREHRDVILASLHGERRRRERHLARRPLVDRHQRRRTQQSLWDPRVDGPPIRHMWDEFHLEATDKPFVASLTELFRLQRVSAMGGDVITQGGGLADLADSVLRGLLNQTRLRLYRMPDSLARLAGYTGAYMPSGLPRIPGVCLTVTAGAPPEPLRSAFVTREDVDGSVFDQLFAPDMTPLLAAPALPAETVEVFKREGLMDLWELGKGPDGLSNLLDDNNALMPPASAVGESVAGSAPKMQAADVILAIVSLNPGCQRQAIDNHEVWLRTAAGGKAPDPSTISRAAKKLVDGCLLSRSDGEYRVTGKGEEHAKLMVAALSPASTEQPQTAAEVEQQAEREAEAREEVDA